MPSGKTHLVVATAASTALTCGLGLPVEYVVAGAIGGLVPDSDHKAALISSILPLWVICKHRGFTHTLTACVLFSGIVGVLFNGDIADVFACGYFSHILIDGMLWKRKRKRRWK